MDGTKTVNMLATLMSQDCSFSVEGEKNLAEKNHVSRNIGNKVTVVTNCGLLEFPRDPHSQTFDGAEALSGYR
jgi:hypothetical protein